MAVSLRLPLLAPASLGESLALCTARELWPAARSDAASLLPEYLAPSQAERAHGIDLSDDVNRPRRIEEWE
jgi:hypothetical protein